MFASEPLVLVVALMTSATRLTPFEVGQVKAHMEHGLGCTSIMKRVKRADGSTFGETAIVNCMNKLKKTPRWRGEREEGSGAERQTTKAQDRQVVKWVEKTRGKKKVTVSKVKKQFPFLKNFSDWLVEERLHEADLWYLRRRGQSIITKEYLRPRVLYCQGVKRMHRSTLERWAYTDGTVYYLDRTEDEHEHTKRRCLGSHVWRRSYNRDAMHQDCLGPSAYNKAQGLPVRVWGFLACGVVHFHVLDEGEAMDTTLYTELVEDKFEGWAGNCEWLVCDFEGCIRSEPAVRALGKAGLKLVEGYPRCSQDFNAMENVWAILKEKLDETVPVRLETREAFVNRLKSAVSWCNRSRRDQLWSLTLDQKERAEACLSAQPKGGRINW